MVGIDWDRFAIEAAQKDAGANEAYVAGDVTTELRWLLQQSDLTSTALIVDPPATGLSAETRRAILDSPPQTMIYVSCNPPTLARDIAELQQRFDVISITPLSTCSPKPPRSRWSRTCGDWTRAHHWNKERASWSPHYPGRMRASPHAAADLAHDLNVSFQRSGWIPPFPSDTRFRRYGRLQGPEDNPLVREFFHLFG